VRAVPTIGLLSEQVCDEIPASHRDLVQCPPVAALTTGMADDSSQTSVVCCDFDGQCVRVNTMRGFVKERNMRRNPRVTLWCYDPHQPLRYLEVRGTVVEMTQAGGRAPGQPRLRLRRPAAPLLRRRHPDRPGGAGAGRGLNAAHPQPQFPARRPDGGCGRPGIGDDRMALLPGPASARWPVAQQTTSSSGRHG
jgi:hypothetical protein